MANSTMPHPKRCNICSDARRTFADWTTLEALEAADSGSSPSPVLELAIEPVIDVRTRELVKLKVVRGSPTPEVIEPALPKMARLVCPPNDTLPAMLYRVCLQAKIHASQQEGNPSLCFPVDVTAIGRPFLVTLKQILAVTELPPHALELVFDVGELGSLSAGTKQTMKDLCGLGIGLALHSFGGRGASLECFEEVDFNTVFLDASITERLTRPLCNPHYPMLLLSSMLAVASVLGMTVVVSEIANAEMMERFLNLGCSVQSGTLFGPRSSIDAPVVWAYPGITEDLISSLSAPRLYN